MASDCDWVVSAAPQKCPKFPVFIYRGKTKKRNVTTFLCMYRRVVGLILDNYVGDLT